MMAQEKILLKSLLCKDRSERVIILLTKARMQNSVTLEQNPLVEKYQQEEKEEERKRPSIVVTMCCMQCPGAVHARCSNQFLADLCSDAIIFLAMYLLINSDVTYPFTQPYFI